MTIKRDKFITEAMGECWHEWVVVSKRYLECNKCGKELTRRGDGEDFVWLSEYPNNFSTWQGFGKLWEWAQKQEWWVEFWYFATAFDHDGVEIAFPRDAQIIHPSRFADAVYNFLEAR